MRTSLYLMKVLPASMPLADLNSMVMIGPWLIARWIGNPDGNEAGKDRDEPDDREAQAPLAHDDRLRERCR